MSAHKTLLKPSSDTISKKKTEAKDAADNRRKHQRKLAHIRHSLQKVELKDFNRVATLGIGGFARYKIRLICVCFGVNGVDSIHWAVR